MVDRHIQKTKDIANTLYAVEVKALNTQVIRMNKQNCMHINRGFNHRSSLTVTGYVSEVPVIQQATLQIW